MIWARSNDIRVELSGDEMSLKVGEEGFWYSPLRVKTRSPLHVLRISQENALLYTKQFTIKISRESLTLRSDGKTRTVATREVADELRHVLAEQARRHIQDIMVGLPIDLDETLSNVEKVLGKYLE